jgi:O-antigen ligase/tetratricopeptide (TPR) repeat protein
LVVSYRFYYPYLFLKSILFRAAVQAMTMLYVVLAAAYPSFRPRLNRLSMALLAYFVVMIIASLPGVSVSPWRSWWGDFARMGGMFSQLHLLAYFFVLVQVIRRERDWLILFTSSLFFGVFMGLSGLIQYLGLHFTYRLEEGQRLHGTTGNAIWFASLMVMNFFIAFWFLSWKDKATVYSLAAKCWLFLLIGMDVVLLIIDAWNIGSGPGVLVSGLSLLPIAIFAAALHAASLCWFFLRRSVAAGVLFFLLLCGFYLFWLYQSETRGAMVGLVGALALLSIFYVFTGTGRLIRWAGLALLLLALIVPSVIWIQRQSSWVQRHPPMVRLTQLSVQDILAARFWAWKASITATWDRPLFGWGPENYSIAFDRHFPPQIINTWESMPWFDRAHNIFLDISTTTGVLGLSCFLLFYLLAFAFLLRLWFRTKDPTNSLLVGALLLSYLIQGLASFDTINTEVLVYLLLAYVVWLYQRGHQPLPEKSMAQPPLPEISARGLLCIGAAIVVLLPIHWYAVKKPYESNLFLNQAVQYSKAVDQGSGKSGIVYWRETLDLFQRASDYQTMGRYLVREELANYTSDLVGMEDAPQAAKVAAAGQAIALLQESVQQDPRDARRYMYLASLVNRCFGVLRSSDPAQARALLEKNLELLRMAEQLSPARPQVYFEMGQTLARLGRYADQAAAIEKGIALNPPLAGARYFDAVVKGPNLDLLFAYVAGGNDEAAAKQWQKIKLLSISLTRSNYDQLATLYASRKQYEAIIRLYKEELAQMPDDPQLLAQLATAYREAGDLEQARQTALKAAALAPGSGPSIQAFLESLKTAAKLRR